MAALRVTIVAFLVTTSLAVVSANSGDNANLHARDVGFEVEHAQRILHRRAAEPEAEPSDDVKDLDFGDLLFRREAEPESELDELDYKYLSQLYRRAADIDDEDIEFLNNLYKREAEAEADADNEFDDFDFTDLMHKRDADNEFDDFDFTDLMYKRDAGPEPFDALDDDDMKLLARDAKSEPEPEPHAFSELYQKKLANKLGVKAAAGPRQNAHQKYQSTVEAQVDAEDMGDDQQVLEQQFAMDLDQEM